MTYEFKDEDVLHLLVGEADAMCTEVAEHIQEHRGVHFLAQENKWNIQYEKSYKDWLSRKAVVDAAKAGKKI